MGERLTPRPRETLDLEREPHDRAVLHRQLAVEAVEGLDPLGAAVVHALLAIEARVDELSWYVAR